MPVLDEELSSELGGDWPVHVLLILSALAGQLVGMGFPGWFGPGSPGGSELTGDRVSLGPGTSLCLLADKFLQLPPLHPRSRWLPPSAPLPL